MTRATKPVRATLHSPDIRSSGEAKKRLIATHPNSKIELTNWNHRLLTISNRNKNKHSCFRILCVPPRLRGELASGCGSRITTHDSRIVAFLIATEVRIEIAVTYRKQRRASSSNRNYFRGASNGSCRSRITNHDSRITRHSSQTNATPRPSNPSRPVLEWMIRARYRLETAAGVAASNDLGMGQRKTA
jgi:hypothetical protein